MENTKYKARWQLCILLLLLKHGILNCKEVVDASVEKDIQENESNLETGQNKEKREINIDSLEDSNLENELEDEEEKQDDSQESDLGNELEEDIAEDDYSQKDWDLEKELEEMDLEHDYSKGDGLESGLEEVDSEQNKNQGDWDVEKELEERDLEHANSQKEEEDLNKELEENDLKHDSQLEENLQNEVQEKDLENNNQGEGYLHKELEEENTELHSSKRGELEKRDLKHYDTQREWNQKTDDSLKEDLENEGTQEEGDLNYDGSQYEEDLTMDDHMDEGTLENGNGIDDSKLVNTRWFGFGIRRRCFCNIISLGGKNATRQRMHTFSTIKTRRTLFCSRRVRRFCITGCLRRFLSLISQRTCLPNQLCQNVKTIKQPQKIGLVLSSRRCFSPRLLWQSNYHLSCNNGTSIVT